MGDSKASHELRHVSGVLFQPTGGIDPSCLLRDPEDSQRGRRGGGHQWFASANSEPEGVTIDLRGLHSVKVSDDRSCITVGAGATWDAVYGALDPLGLSVAGGQVAGSPTSAPARVTRFEVVLADGPVVEAAETGPNADLWWGLRGGTNNFGIVTSMTYRTFKQDLLWQTMTVHPITEADNLARTIAKLMAGGSTLARCARSR
ncbi:hypothetical protein PG996_008504 [Apiospora saccharicola]|uniref:FAD linked oxidase N-terminal domain-containing protein n=1 Tax=Apiospora saccharicola TaxID=335842 RepID=A0ABR1UY39_9PEZI